MSGVSEKVNNPICFICGEPAKVGLLTGNDTKPHHLCASCFAIHVNANTQIINGLLYYRESNTLAELITA
jgi:hypothetical protein